MFENNPRLSLRVGQAVLRKKDLNMSRFYKKFTGSWREISKNSKETTTVRKTRRKKPHLGDRNFGPRLGQLNFADEYSFWAHYSISHNWSTHANIIIQWTVRHPVKVHAFVFFKTGMHFEHVHRKFERCQNGPNISEGFITNCLKMIYEEKPKLATARGQWPKTSESSLYCVETRKCIKP